jgi:hypothetical protein
MRMRSQTTFVNPGMGDPSFRLLHVKKGKWAPELQVHVKCLLAESEDEYPPSYLWRKELEDGVFPLFDFSTLRARRFIVEG